MFRKPDRQSIAWALAALSFSILFLSLPATASATPAGSSFDHIVIIAMENQNYPDVLGDGTPAGCPTGTAPFLCSLLLLSSTIPSYHSYGATSSISGCSAACYVALISGDTYGVGDGYSCCLSGSTLLVSLHNHVLSDNALHLVGRVRPLTQHTVWKHDKGGLRLDQQQLRRVREPPHHRGELGTPLSYERGIRGSLHVRHFWRLRPRRTLNHFRLTINAHLSLYRPHRWRSSQRNHLPSKVPFPQSQVGGCAADEQSPDPPGHSP